MSDETKFQLGLIGLVALITVVVGLLIYASERDKAALRQAACVNPETVACALAVRR
jgi:hypothetical protein